MKAKIRYKCKLVLFILRLEVMWSIICLDTINMVVRNVHEDELFKMNCLKGFQEKVFFSLQFKWWAIVKPDILEPI